MVTVIYDAERLTNNNNNNNNITNINKITKRLCTSTCAGQMSLCLKRPLLYQLYAAMGQSLRPLTLAVNSSVQFWERTPHIVQTDVDQAMTTHSSLL